MILFGNSCRKKMQTSVNLFVDDPFYEHQLAFNLTINDSAYLFIWDTGSTQSCINDSIATSLGLNNEKKPVFGKTILINKSIEDTFYYQKIDFKLGDFSMNTHFLLGGPVINHILSSDSHIKGLIGQDIISRFYWLFDLKAAKVIASKTPIPLGTTKDMDILTLPFMPSQNGHDVVIKLKLDSLNSKEFTLDTGHRSFMDIDFFSKKNRIYTALTVNDEIAEALQYKLPLKFTNTESLKQLILCDSLRVNETLFNNICIANENYYTKQNYITVNFIFLFDKMYYNPVDHEIKLISDKKNEGQIGNVGELIQGFKAAQQSIQSTNK